RTYRSWPASTEGFVSSAEIVRRRTCDLDVARLYSTIRLPRDVATWKTTTSPSSAGRPSWLDRLAAAIVLTSVGASIGRALLLSPRADGARVTSQRSETPSASTPGPGTAT